MVNRTHTHRVLILASMLAVVGGVFFYVFNMTGIFHRSTSLTQRRAPTPVPSSAPLAPQVKEARYPSSDGKKILIVKTTKHTQDTSTFAFSVTTQTSQSGQLLFTKSVNTPTTLTVPFNAWSPDNRYFFIQEHMGTNIITHVYASSGQPFADGELSHNVNLFFAEKEASYLLKEITGWAAPTLLLVNTKYVDSEKNGPTFWFDVTRNTVTRLSTSFQ